MIEVEAQRSHADPGDEAWVAGQRGCIFQPLAPAHSHAAQIDSAVSPDPYRIDAKVRAWPLRINQNLHPLRGERGTSQRQDNMGCAAGINALWARCSLSWPPATASPRSCGG